MRVYSAVNAPVSAPVSHRPGPRGAFSLGASSPSASAAPASAPKALGSIEALLALQAVDDRPERRRRAIRHGRAALDALEGLKVGLLAGSLDRESLGRLRACARELTVSSGDEGLDSVLAEIALRAEVELAKLDRA